MTPCFIIQTLRYVVSCRIPVIICCKKTTLMTSDFAMS